MLWSKKIIKNISKKSVEIFGNTKVLYYFYTTFIKTHKMATFTQTKVVFRYGYAFLYNIYFNAGSRYVNQQNAMLEGGYKIFQYEVDLTDRECVDMTSDELDRMEQQIADAYAMYRAEFQNDLA